jgi:hypothetical protein
VLAALIPTDTPYPPPVDALRSLGPIDDPDVTRQRAQLTFGQQHLHALVRMARDRKLNTAWSDDVVVWAPIHALEVLRDLDVSSVIADILPLCDVDGDWLDSALIPLMADVGRDALQPLTHYLHDPTRWVHGRGRAAEALEWLARQHPDLRPQVVAALSTALQAAEQSDAFITSSIIAALIELGAEETLPLMRAVFESGRVEELITGDWAEVLHNLGHEPDPHDPLVAESARRLQEQREALFPTDLLAQMQHARASDAASSQALPPAPRPARPAPPPQPAPAAASRTTASEQKRKAKQKRKQAKASRKANQRKHKRK